MSEEWRPVVGFEGVYEVSDLGRVKRVKPAVGTRAGTILRPILSSNGHYVVTLRDHPRVQIEGVHRVVLKAFVGPPPEGTEGCHFPDVDPANNHLSNLRWGTRSDNRIDSVKHGTHFSTQKTHCPRRHALVQPNLDPHRARKGHRICLSCNVERKRAWHAGEEFSTERADSYYLAIMPTQTATPAVTAA